MNKKFNRIIVLLIALFLIVGSVTSVYAQEKYEKSAGKKIRVAMLQYPNFIDYDQDGNPSGYACDYLDEIAKYTGWTYEYVPVSFKDAQKMLEEGQLDIIPGTQYTQERAQLYDYGEVSMLMDSNVLCVPADNTDYYYNDFKALEGKNIGVMTGSIRKEQFAQVLDNEGVSVNFIEFDTNDEEKAALEAGNVSAILMSMLRCTEDYRIIASTNPTDVYFTCNPNDQSIKEELDNAQQEILSTNPYYGLQLAEEHYGNVPRAYAFTDEERKFMESCPVITVAVSTDMSPIEYYDENSKSFKGLVVNYFDRISEITGLKFQFVERGDEKSIKQALEDNTIQLLATATEGGYVEKTYPVTLTETYIQNSVELVYNDKMENPLSTDGKIALKSGFVYYQNLAKQQGYKDIVYYDTFTECVDAVNKGTVDVTYLPSYSLSSLTEHAYLRNIKVLSSEIANYQCSIGVSNQCNPLLVSILDKALVAIPTTEKDTMLLNAVSSSSYSKSFKDLFYENLTLILGLIILISVILGAVGLWIAFRRNITNHKLAEAMEIAENASAAKTDFMSRMSHDMRTPMNGILGLTELSVNEKDVSVLTGNMNKIRREGQYLLCLINDTLDFQKIESGKLKLEPQIVSTRELITSIITMIKSDAQKDKVDVQVDVEDIEIDSYVKVDPVRIKHVFVNLVSNAVKFTPPGGSVKIAFKCVERTDNIAHDIITITDTGIGMSKEFIENRIFKPFSQEHSDIVSNYSGSGLGLSIAKRLVELMNGNIFVESELGEGSCFTVQLDFELADKS